MGADTFRRKGGLLGWLLPVSPRRPGASGGQTVALGWLWPRRARGRTPLRARGSARAAAARAGPTGWPRPRVSCTPLPAPPSRRLPDMKASVCGDLSLAVGVRVGLGRKEKLPSYPQTLGSLRWVSQSTWRTGELIRNNERERHVRVWSIWEWNSRAFCAGTGRERQNWTPLGRLLRFRNPQGA